jgi:hypothetical protein
VVKEVLVAENDITIRHSIPIPSGSPPNGGLPRAGDPNYLLCKGSDCAKLSQHSWKPWSRCSPWNSKISKLPVFNTDSRFNSPASTTIK